MVWPTILLFIVRVLITVVAVVAVHIVAVVVVVLVYVTLLTLSLLLPDLEPGREPLPESQPALCGKGQVAGRGYSSQGVKQELTAKKSYTREKTIKVRAMRWPSNCKL